MRVALLVLVLLPICSCGLGIVPSQASCDGRPSGSQACVDLLTNKNSQFDSTLKALCVGTYASNKLCDHTGAIGGCQCDSCENGKAVEWLFPDPANNLNTVDDVKKACNGRTFVMP